MKYHTTAIGIIATMSIWATLADKSATLANTTGVLLLKSLLHTNMVSCTYVEHGEQFKIKLKTIKLTHGLSCINDIVLHGIKSLIYK